MSINTEILIFLNSIMKKTYYKTKTKINSHLADKAIKILQLVIESI